MTAEEIKKDIAKGFEDLKATHEEYKTKYEALKGDNEAMKQLAKEAADKMTDLQAHVNDLDTLLQKKKAEENAPKRSSAEMEKLLSEHSEGIKKMFDTQSNSGISSSKPEYVISKAPANILTSTNYTGGIFGLTQWDSETTRPARLTPRLRQIVRTKPVSTLYVQWVELVNRDGGAAWTAEGALKPQLDFDYQEQNKMVETLPVWTRASRQALDDIPQLASDINLELIDDLNLKLDAALYDGPGVSPVIRGIKTYAPTVSFTGSAFALGIQTPNRADTLMAVVALQRSKFFPPTHILVNEQEYALMMMDKATDGNSLNRPYITSDGTMFIGNVQVVPTMRVPVGEFIVGDMSKFVLGIREDITIRVSENVNDDFTRNMIVFLAELRAVSYVKSNHIDAFAKGTFAAAITALTRP